MSTSSGADEPLVGTVAIIGVGLIGGSIAAALKQRSLANCILGVGRNPERLEHARQRGLIDRAAGGREAVAAADLVIWCTPADLIADDVRELRPHARPETLLTDAGSVKAAICTPLASPDPPIFIGSHPLTGSERQGFEHADADLFVDRVCVITPEPSTPPEAVGRLQRFWEALGMSVLELSAEDHDRTLARTSHLPHLLAAALAASLADGDSRLTASGFRDTTRIAAGDPLLWLPILLDNAAAVTAALDRFEGRLAEFRAAISSRDREALKILLEQAKTVRDGLP